MSTSSLKKFLKKSITLAGLCSLALPAVADWTVKDGKLLDPNGNPFVFRGVTIDHTLAPEKTLQALKDIAALGANSAQIEFPIRADGLFPRKVIAELREIIQACKDNKLVCVLEPNDTAGYEIDRYNYVRTAALLWGEDDMREVLNGTEQHIILGISNHLMGSTIDRYVYANEIRDSLFRMRFRYPHHMMMADGNKWGQDTDGGFEQLAFLIKAHGESPNLIYSIEMGDAYQTPEQVRDYIANLTAKGVSVVVGGFGPFPYYHPYFPLQLSTPLNVPRLPVESVMQYAEQFGAGYFGWSWSGNKESALDIALNWNPADLTHWGNSLFNDPNGIKATARTASIFPASTSSSSSSFSLKSSASSSSSPTNTPPVAAITFVFQSSGGCPVSVYGNASALESYDPDGDILTYQWEVTGNYTTIKASEPQIRFHMQPPHNYTIKLTVSDGKGGISTTTIIRNHQSSDYCTGSSSSSWRPSSSSIAPSSSSKPAIVSSSSVRPSSISSSSRSSSSIAAKASCSYVIGSQWGNGFTAAIRVKNTGTHTLNGWSVNWQYSDGSKVTNSWNASFSGSNPYNAKNLSWNANIQPGQTVEFGFQGSKPAGTAVVPVVTGAICQ